jgi:hypothetical protein
VWDVSTRFRLQITTIPRRDSVGIRRSGKAHTGLQQPCKFAPKTVGGITEVCTVRRRATDRVPPYHGGFPLPTTCGDSRSTSAFPAPSARRPLCSIALSLPGKPTTCPKTVPKKIICDHGVAAIPREARGRKARALSDHSSAAATVTTSRASPSSIPTSGCPWYAPRRTAAPRDIRDNRR